MYRLWLQENKRKEQCISREAKSKIDMLKIKSPVLPVLRFKAECLFMGEGSDQEGRVGGVRAWR